MFVKEFIQNGVRQKTPEPSSASPEHPYWVSHMQDRDIQISYMSDFANASEEMLRRLNGAGLRMDAKIDPEAPETIFTRALTGGNLERIGLMIDLGANINDGMVFVIRSSANLDIIKYLLKRGADINNALSVAVQIQRYEITWYLLHNGANPELKIGSDAWLPIMYVVSVICANIEKDTTLAVVTSRGGPLTGIGGDCLTYLIEKTTDKNVRGTSGMTPLLIASKYYGDWYTGVSRAGVGGTNPATHGPMIASIMIFLAKSGFNTSYAIGDGRTAAGIVAYSQQNLGAYPLVQDLRDIFVNNGENFNTSLFAYPDQLTYVTTHSIVHGPQTVALPPTWPRSWSVVENLVTPAGWSRNTSDPPSNKPVEAMIGSYDDIQKICLS
jgi:hypothetical protein